VTLVHDLNVLTRPNGAVGIGWRATAYDTWKWDPVKIEDGGGHRFRDQNAQQAVVDNRVRSVDVERERELGIQIRFPQLLVFQRPGGPNCREIAQGRRKIVVVGLTELDAGILRWGLLLLGGDGTRSKEC